MAHLSNRNSLLVFITILFSTLNAAPHPAMTVDAPTLTNKNTLNFHFLLLKQQYVEIPLRKASKQDTLLIKLTFGDGIPRLFILDTGATRTAIDEKIANQYHMQNTGRRLSTTGAGGNRIWTHYALIPKLEYPPSFQATSQLAVVLNSIPQEDNEPIVGIIGLDFLRAHHAIIDIPKQQIYLKSKILVETLTQNESSSDQTTFQNELLRAGYKIVHLERTTNLHQAISVQINYATPESFLLDTGAPVSVVDLAYAQTLQLQPIGITIDGQGSTGGQIKIFPTRVEKISIQGIEWNPSVFYMTTGLDDIKAGIAVHGVIGMDWLRAHYATLDTTQDEVFALPQRKHEGRKSSHSHHHHALTLNNL